MYINSPIVKFLQYMRSLSILPGDVDIYYYFVILTYSSVNIVKNVKTIV